MTLRQFSSELEGHPTPRIPGVDAATGSLGQGLSVGAGIGAGRALPEIRRARLRADGRRRNGRGQRLGSRRVRRPLQTRQSGGDGRRQRAGPERAHHVSHDTDVYRRKFESQGWATEVVDGHDMAAVVAALDHARATRGKPYAIIARTEKGHGISFLADKDGWHGKALSPEQLEKALAEMGGPMPPVSPRMTGAPMRANRCRCLRDFPAPPRRRNISSDSWWPRAKPMARG